MSRTTSQNILLTVTNPTGPPLPSWASSTAVGSWSSIPNSNMVAGVGSSYLTSLGFSPSGGTVLWGANKYGANWVGSSYDPMSLSTGRSDYCGLTADRRNSIVWIGSGNSNWPGAEYHKLDLTPLSTPNAPVWSVAAISGPDAPPQGASYDAAHAGLYYKKPQVVNGSTYPTVVAPDDARPERHYDGTHRGGHTYWCQQFIEGKNWIIHFGAFQYYPVDQGNSDNIAIADTVSGKWHVVEEIAAPGFGGQGQVVPQQIVKDYITEDVYLWRTTSSRLMRWRWNQPAPYNGGQWEVVYNFGGFGGVYSSLLNLAMCVEPVQRYVLCLGRMGNTVAGVQRFCIDLTRTDPNMLGKFVPVVMTGNASDVAVTWSSSTNTVTMAEARPIGSTNSAATVQFYGASVPASGQPDINTGQVYRWVRTGSTTGTLLKRDPNTANLVPVTITANGSGTMTRMNFSCFHPIEWCPDIQGGSMIGFQDDQMLYNFTKDGVSGASFIINVDEYPTTGIPGFHSATQDSAVHSGGVLTGFKYLPEIHGFIYFQDGNMSLQYLRIY